MIRLPVSQYGILTPCTKRADRRALGISGFTLVEILVAACVLAIGTIALASIFPLMVQLQEQLTYTQIAAAEARSELGHMAHMAMNANDNQWKNFNSNTHSGTVDGLPEGNSKVVTISNYPSDESRYLKLVTVKITWPSKSNDGRTGGEASYSTLVVRTYFETDASRADI